MKWITEMIRKFWQGGKVGRLIVIALPVIIISSVIIDIVWNYCKYTMLIAPEKYHEYLPSLCKDVSNTSKLDLFSCIEEAEHQDKDFIVISEIIRFSFRGDFKDEIIIDMVTHRTIYSLSDIDSDRAVQSIVIGTSGNSEFKDYFTSEYCEVSLNSDQHNCYHTYFKSIGTKLFSYSDGHTTFIKLPLKDDRPFQGLRLNSNEIALSTHNEEFPVVSTTIYIESEKDNVKPKQNQLWRWKNPNHPVQDGLINQHRNPPGVDTLIVGRTKFRAQNEEIGIVVSWQ